MRHKKRQLAPADFEHSRATAGNLRSLRLKKGKTLKFVAGVIGITSAYLSDLEAGRRCLRPEFVKAYRKALAV